jgi:hypothetical protein
MRFPIVAAIAAMIALGSPQAAAVEAGDTDAQAILVRQQSLRAEVTARNGRYRDMDETRRQKLFAHQDTVTRLLTGVTRTTELPEQDRLAVSDALKAIESIVAQAEGDRLVCRRHKPIGSNRPQQICKSVRQQRAEQEASQEVLRRERQ